MTQHGFQDSIGIDVDQRRFRTERDRSYQSFVLGVAFHVRIAVGARHAAEKRNVRTRYPCQQQQYGGESCEQDALEYAEKQDTHKSDRSGVKIQPAYPPHVKQRPKIEKS